MATRPGDKPKPIAGLADARALWSAAGVASQAFGVITATEGADAIRQLVDLLDAHRVWERFPAQH
ncbi:hypothetical protein [Kitasatospora purpeofusca]|uniref:hypothetical protein n=1 Tax=Kitasatospora purpeofusca TaxID=67352 RepID=UPI0035D9B2A1